ncbi:CapA family protein [Umezawaea sp.]|uniref:CapA family protein n=1 Tax=Umezawaea sp. TaxID=1955258 RepID=UPI002ED15CA8
MAALAVLAAVTACTATGGDPVAVRAPAPTTGSSAARPAPTPPPRSFTLAAGGDILIHPALTDQARADGGGTPDFRPLLEGMREAVAADLSICHLETPLSAPGAPTFGYPAFSAPPEIAAALVDLGYDSCSTASNHTLDRDVPGVRTTLDVLDSVGLKHTGSARSPEEAATPLILDANGVKVAQVSFTYGYNGIPLPEPWIANTLDPRRVVDAARAAKAAGAEVVVASLHWGAEYEADPTPEQRAAATTILADPAVDLIIGTHVHTVQPIERIGEKWVVYGMGNEVAKHEEPRGTTEEGLIARFRFVEGPQGWRVDEARYRPTLVELGPPIRVVDLSSAPPSPRRAEALARTDEVVGRLGAAAAGLGR